MEFLLYIPDNELRDRCLSEKYEPETNIFRLALFTAYLPQLLQGPIGRYDRLAPQLFEPHDFNLKNIEYGAQRIAWGLAKS